MGSKQRGAGEDDQRNTLTHFHGEPSRGWAIIPGDRDGVGTFRVAPAIKGILDNDHFPPDFLRRW